MAVRIGDTLKQLNNADFPIVEATDVAFSSGDSLQKLYDEGGLGGDDSTILTEQEYNELPEEEKIKGTFYLYDTGKIFKNSVQYGVTEPIELTYQEYSEMKEQGLIDPDQEYIVSADAEGILLEASDIGYSNAVSNLPCNTVQGAIDKVAEKVDGLISDTDLTSTTSTLSASKINTELVKKESVYIANSSVNLLYYAAQYLGEDPVQYGLYNVTITDDKGNFGEFNFIYKHATLIYGYIISENGITLAGINNTGTLAMTSTSEYKKYRVKYLGEPTEDMSAIPNGGYTRANKNALASEITSTFLIKDIAAGGENEKTFSFKVRKNYFTAYYAKRTFLLSANIYSLGFSKPVISLVEIFRGSADNYDGYVVNLQDTRFTGVTVTVNGDYLEIDVTLNSYESSGCMVSCSSLSNIPIV